AWVFNRNSGFTCEFLRQWAGSLCPTMELLYQLSYNGNNPRLSYFSDLFNRVYGATSRIPAGK
ncbi:MAG: hypothetical protein Q7R94_00350, partial [bacterium]|nr:hypothetical protein [bacterium]